ncbi:MAG: YqaJ viral recombinase family protein [Thermoguttaceae bacterium]|nr:YqaJ viral recombinase family protein [Bacillota bacterium]MBQ4142824.1 YqaJ viral recombinase family protein [Thermoguttaceae bacterium]
MDRTQWLAERRKGIGGSDAAAIAGLSSVIQERIGKNGTPYKVRPFANIPTPLELWLDKTGQCPRDSSENLYTLKGHAMEPLLLRMYEEKTGRTLLPKPEILRHKEHTWMCASLDGWTEESVVDAKTSMKLEIWGKEGSNEVPMPIYCQMQWYLMVTEKQRADVIVWLECGNYMDVRIYEIFPDRELQNALFERGQAFWQCVRNMLPPDPVDVCDLEYLFPKVEPYSMKAVPPDIYENVFELFQIRTARQQATAEWDAREESLKFRILKYARNCEQLLFNGRTIATIRTSKTGRKTITPKGFYNESKCNDDESKFG